MANKLYEESSVSAIASAIRVKNGSSATYKIGDMAAAVLAIPTGGGDTGVNAVLIEGSSEDYTIPYTYFNDITKIKKNAFYQDTYLKRVEIPSTVTEIGDQAFSSTGIKTLVCYATTPPTAYSNTFYGLNNQLVSVYVPDAQISAYQAATGWNYLTNVHWYGTSEL